VASCKKWPAERFANDSDAPFMLIYLHPLTGGACLVLLLYVAALGLRMRTARRDRDVLARRHAQLAPYAYGLIAVSWGIGLACTHWLRSQLDLAASLHFRVGTLIVIFLSASALTAYGMRRRWPDLRELHPWLGATAALLAVAQMLTGLQLFP